VWGADLAAGRAKRSPDHGPLEVVAGGLLSVGDGAENVRDFARPMTALYVGGMGAKGRNFYNDLVKRYGFEAEAEAIQDLYLDGKKDEAAKLVPEAMLEATTLCGPEGYVKERIAAFKESGVTVLNVTPIGPDPVKLIEQVRTWIDDA
jgi:alkanesulfonate monooxygenase SsuD/methylene tetrahydromethanopterin reductase-like flavin-dependent oxidoreductase (luciferase family)